jgi:DNA-binding HxlR family transcriptional regulator
MRQAKYRKKKGTEAADAVNSVLSQKWKLIIIQRIIQE